MRRGTADQQRLDEEPVDLTCVGCGRRVASPYLTVDQLRTLTGFRVSEDNDWCGECAAALRQAGTLDDD